MKFCWYGEEIEVKDDKVRGICSICGLPILKDICVELLEIVENDDLFTDLVFDMGDVHEMCLMDSSHFHPALQKTS